MQVCVIVPTTDGPAPILRLTCLAHAPRSVMRTQDDYRPLPPSGRYHAFVQTGGALADRLGQEGGQFELRLGAAVETGRSWELPVAIAHWLLGQGHELAADAPDLVIWATGALDNDLSLLRRDYHLGSKLEQSVGSLQDALRQGARVCMLLPEAVEVPAELDLAGVVHHRIEGFEAAVNFLAGDPGFLRLQDVSETALVGGAAGRARASGAKLAAGAFVIGVTAFLLWMAGDWRAGPREGTASTANDPFVMEAATVEVPVFPSDVGEDAPSVPQLVLNYAPDEGGCAAVLFGSVVPDQRAMEPEGSAYPVISSTGLCGIGFRLPDAAPSDLEIALPQELSNFVLPSDRRARLRLLPGETQVLRFRAGQPTEFEMEIGVTRELEATRNLTIVAIP